MVANTSAYSELEVTLSTRNIKTVYTECLSTNVNKLLLLTQSAATHMAEGDCEPFCQGVRACDVTQTQVNTTTQTEKHTFLCRCPGDTCADLALFSSDGMAIDPALSMGICDIQTNRVKLQDIKGVFP